LWRALYNSGMIVLRTLGLVAFTFVSTLQAQVLRFAAIPEEPAPIIQQRFTPLLRYLETRGMSGVIIATPDMNSFIDAVTAKRVDFAWISGFSFVQARARMSGNLTCVAHRKEDVNFQSVVVTRDAQMSSLDGIAGKTIVFGPRASLSGHLMPRHFIKQLSPAALAQANALRFAVSHESVLEQIKRGVGDVGVLNAASFFRMKEDGKIADDALRVVYTTPTYTDYCFALTGDRDPTLFTALQNALVALDPRRPEHAAILSSLRATRLVAATDDAYSDVEAIAKEVGLIR
jgi:phosphonate transport system substrate-binding protein